MKLKFLLAALLSGVLLSVAWFGLGGMILLVAFVPLLWIDNHFAENKQYNTSFAFWSYSVLTLLTWNSLSTWWIWHASPVGALFAVVLNTFLMSLVWWIVHESRRVKGNGFANFMLVFCWLSFEYLHFQWDLSWPWLTLGNGLANNIEIIQWYEFTGVFGGSLWILIINIAFWNVLKSYRNRFVAGMNRKFILVASLLSLPILISSIQYRNYSEVSDPIKVVIAQPNIDPYTEKFERMPYEDQYSRLLGVCDSLGTWDVDFFIGPETALHDVWLDRMSYNPSILHLKHFIADKYPNSAFIVGAMTYQKYSTKANASQSARYMQDSTFIYDAFNSAVLINKNGAKEVYHKSKLVSGVEKMPFASYFGFMNRLIVDLGGTTGTLGTLNEPVVFEHNGIKLGVPICYESDFGEYVAEFIGKGAELLFIITNDGWWKNSPGYKQHFSYSRIMAIQLRRSIARSGNTGISALINQRGEVVQKSKWWTKTAIVGELNKNNSITFYAKHGDYIARISVFMFVLMGFSLLVSKLKR